ncbi:hypothetical protein Mpet_0045 [Methanolacinia petrolearia DSM 11571]|uniref:DUF1097 domain-containing protein n=1 Tax=Methanolacinia petrolearia (strain DSM 11571 / OCM 486 / SEBR 4847) TaxID=679926 RepID=E1RDE2_METP4|nr:hypothetical protein [Methanolacinia petrolearia]ADN34826.1 hypothetical protein Mpet_0045 [Methanolacinia petrolearia DSM 11571]
MPDNSAVTAAAGILCAGLLIQAAFFFFISLPAAPVLPAFACIAVVVMQSKRSKDGLLGADYIKTGLAGLAAGILSMPFASSAAVAAAGVIACPVGTLAALAVFMEMTKKEENFAAMFSVFSGSLVAGMFIIAAGFAGEKLHGPATVLGEFIPLLIVSLLAGLLCQGIIIALKKDNSGIKGPSP